MRLDVKENIVFPFSDPSWIVKTLIGTACQMLGFTMPAVIGYQLSIIRQTANGEDDRLPEWEGFGSLWFRGFLVMMVMGLLTAVPVSITVGVVVSGFMSAGEGGPSGVMVGAFALALLVLFVFYFALMFLMPAMLLRYAMTEQLGSFLDVSTAIGDIKQGFGDYLAVFFFPILASIALMLLSFLTFGFGMLLTIPGTVLVMFIQARMIGNYYRAYFM